MSKRSGGGVLLLFAHGMQVEVPLGTVLCFNPLSLSPHELSTMPDVQVCIGSVLNRIIFQTKQAVLDIFPQSFIGARHSFERHTGRRSISGTEEASIKQISIENSDWLEFSPIIFDYMRRQYDHHHSNPNANTE